MRINPQALIVGAALGFLIAAFVGVWERKMAKKKKEGIVTLSILGGYVFAVILFAVIGEIAPYSYVSDTLRNVIIATLFTFLPIRRVMRWINLVPSDEEDTNDDDNNDK